jgi:transcriptional regulator with XRE-family HTH domain
MSQRQLAEALRVSPSTIGRLEAGGSAPSVRLIERILAVAGLRLVAVDGDGRLVLPMEDWQDIEDGAGRRYPSHLDTIVDPRVGEWWADQYGLARPPETFRRDRGVRDAERRRSQWEVRVAKYRFDPPPPNPGAARRWGA